MTNKHILTGFFILVAASLLIAGCSGSTASPTTAPTVDANAIYTQAAQTVQAGMALTQAANPPTQAPPEPAAAPTFTMDPAMATALTATANAVLQPGVPTPTQAGQIIPVVLPTATQAVVQPAAATGDKCEWVSNTPSDNTKLPKNSIFDATIKVKNTGTTTWDNRYALRYYAGERMGVPSDYFVQHAVAPNEVYAFEFEMETPSSIGKKEVLIVIQNPDGRNMCFINLPYEIVD